MYLCNEWYVAAWSDEIGDDLFTRTIHDHSILFYRKSDGQIAAVENRCPHRFAPLHLGERIGDHIQCGYHGLRFDERGDCVYNHIGDGKIPERARIPAYRIIERFGLVWIWMGRTDAADESKIPDYSILDDNAWVSSTGGYLYCKAGYLLMLDNLMDLSHVGFVHPAFGNTSMATAGELDVAKRGRGIDARLWMPGSEVPPYLQDRFCPDSPIDQWLDMTWQPPSNLIINYGATLHGVAKDEGFTGWGLHFLTPETEKSCHYYFGIMRKQGPGAQKAVDADHASQQHAFGSEDKPMVEACQAMMGNADFLSLKPALLRSDAGAMQVRRTIERMLKEESKDGSVKV